MQGNRECIMKKCIFRFWTVGESTHQQRYWKTSKSYNWALLRIVIRSERNIIVMRLLRFSSIYNIKTT